MATYTKLNQHALEEIIRPYNLGSVRDFTEMKGGLANSSFIISTDSGRYVLSVCDEKNKEEIGLLTSLLQHLSDHQFTTSRLVKTADERFYVMYDNKPVYLKTYIEGTVETMLSPEMLVQVGSALAELHQIPPLEGLPTTFSYGLENFDQVHGQPGPFPEWLQTIRPQIERSCRSDLPTGLVHGDLFSDNMVFSHTNLGAVLDFEEACNYYLVFDLGMCITGCCFRNNQLLESHAAAMISGYQKRRKLTPAETEVLQEHIIYGAAATAFWRYRQFNMIYPGSEKRDAYQEMVACADQVNTINRETFKTLIR
ncbi:MAG: homoserine kinase [Desulfobulbaceae bacterium]|nr:MAG: homoserine kinase [Desulfobulbaceae bacterium]